MVNKRIIIKNLLISTVLFSLLINNNPTSIATAKAQEINAESPAESIEFAMKYAPIESLMKEVNSKKLYTVLEESESSMANYNGQSINIKLDKYFISNEIMAFIFMLEGESLGEINIDKHSMIDLKYKVLNKDGELIVNTDDIKLANLSLIHDKKDTVIIAENVLAPAMSENDLAYKYFNIPGASADGGFKIIIEEVALHTFGSDRPQISGEYELDFMPHIFSGPWELGVAPDKGHIDPPVRHYEVVNHDYAISKGILINHFFSTPMATYMSVTIDTDKNSYSLAQNDFPFYVKLENEKPVSNTDPNSLNTYEFTMSVSVLDENILLTGWSDVTRSNVTEEGVQYNLYMPTIYYKDSEAARIIFFEKTGGEIFIDLLVEEG